MSTLARHATRQRAASDIAMQVGVRILNLALGAVVTALVVRTLGSSGYGRWATLFAVTGLVAYFAEFGMEGVALREAAREPEAEHEWIGSVMMLRLLAIGPVMALCFGVLLLLPHNEQMLIAGAILVVAMPLGGVSSLGLLFQLRVDNRIPMLVLSIRSVLWGAAVLVIHLEGGGMVPFAIAMVATNFVGTIVNTLAALRLAERRPRPVFTHVRKILRVAVPIGISGLLIIAYAQIDEVIVYSISGSREAGLYGAVYNILNQTHFVPISILTTLAPVLAASWPEDPVRLKRTARLTAELLSVVSFGGLAFTIVAAGPVVRLLFGAGFSDAAPALPVLLGAFVLICYGYLNGNLMLVLGKQDRMLRISLVALVFNVAGNLVLVPLVGFIGAAWMTLLTEAVVFFFTTRLLAAHLEIRRPAVGRVARTAAAAVVLGLALGALRLADAPLGVLVLAALALYPALLFGLRAIGTEDVRVLLRRGASA
ncbi:MAG TPA: flippase [Solirubrobacteraceae bacterium]|nr:flippase [Solirubrobacteraceae bacterium]